MEYTIQKLAKMAGVSTRTLRYYDEIGLLPPARVNSAGYRIYSGAQVSILQEILLYKTMDFSLEEIYLLIQSNNHDHIAKLQNHLASLMQKEKQIQIIIATVRKTLAVEKGETTMNDIEKFEGLKQNMVKENEEKYGAETRKKYGEDVVEKSNAKWMNMSEKDFDTMNEKGAAILSMLEDAVKINASPSGEIGQKIAQLHKEWLSFTWPSYSAEAHLGLAHMYIEDERFTAYYDKNVPGAALFLRDAIVCMAEQSSK